MTKKTSTYSLTAQLTELRTQFADRRVPDLDAHVYWADQRVALLEQRNQDLLALLPTPQHSEQLLDNFDDEAYRVLNAEQLQHTTQSPREHFKALPLMQTRWMQSGHRTIILRSDQHLVVVCYLHPHETAKIAQLYALLLDLQWRYEVTTMQMGTALLDMPEFNRLYAHNVKDHYGELQYTLQYLKQRYPSLQHSLIFGTAAKNAYWSLALAGLPRVAVFDAEEEVAVSKSSLQEVVFWANGGVAPRSVRPFMSALFAEKSLQHWDYTDPASYRRLDWITLLDQAQARYKQQQIDHQHIRQSRQFVSSFFSPAFNETADQSIYIDQYLQHWHSGIEPRKPCPGFHPGIYAEHNQLPPAVEPFGHYIAQGQPPGLWRQRVVQGDAVQMVPDAPVALHIHAYYMDMLPQLLQRIEYNTLRPDLFISVASAADANKARAATQHYAARVVVRVVPNRGRDIGPFLTEFGPELVQQYRYIGHIHTKQSLHVVERDAVTAWQSFLLDAVLGGAEARSGRMLDACVSHLAVYKAVQIIYPDDPKIIGWDNNRLFAQLLVDKMGLGTVPDAFNFPAGTMFWLSAEFLQHFVALDLQWDDYPIEPVGKDGTMLHALERLFGAVPLLLNRPYSLAWATGLSR